MAVFGLALQYYVKGSLRSPLILNEMATAFERAGLEAGRFGEHVFPRVLPVLEKEVKGQFEAEGRGPNRGKWLPLEAKYAARKAKLYPGRPILVATGRLKKALTDGNSGSALRHYSRTELRFGTMGVVYASVHQTGMHPLWDKSRAHGVADRPIFDFTPDFEKNLRNASLAAARDIVKASHVGEFASGPLTQSATEGP